MTRELMRKRAEPMRVATKRKSVMPNCHGVSFGVPNVPDVQSSSTAAAISPGTRGRISVSTPSAMPLCLKRT